MDPSQLSRRGRSSIGRKKRGLADVQKYYGNNHEITGSRVTTGHDSDIAQSELKYGYLSSPE
jgi:hypothetical protein